MPRKKPIAPGLCGGADEDPSGKPSDKKRHERGRVYEPGQKTDNEFIKEVNEYLAKIRKALSAEPSEPVSSEHLEKLMDEVKRRITVADNEGWVSMGDVLLQLYRRCNTYMEALKHRGMGHYRGKGAIAPNNILQLIAKEAYKPNPSRTIGQYHLLSATPTLKFYRSGNTVIVGIRGTVPTDFEDVRADGLIPINQLETTNRYKKDLAELSRVRSALPTDDFYGVGHSLGGAILDAFLQTGMVKSGVSYNPAVQPKNFQSNIPNHRIYQKGDPLYAIGKRFLKNTPEVREPKPMSWTDRLISLVPYAGKVYNYINSHNLTNFDGGKKFAESPTPLNPLSKEEYLKRARASAKRHGLPYKLLGYSDDNIHKLQIPDPDGKIIRFGRKGYGDFIIYSALEASGKVAKGMADMKRNVFHKSHSKIKGNWSQNAFSPNNLALKVLW